jgi:V8-like Glu-specific endopeptidase
MIPLALALAACASLTSASAPAAAPSRPPAATPSGSPAATPSRSPAGTPSRSPDGVGRVGSDRAAKHAGALFRAGAGDHFCSGTVVTGGGADLVVTAAHCVTSGPGLAAYEDLEYAPAYRHGTAPYGVWKAARVTIDPRWTQNSDPDLDVAFIELAPRDGQRVADVVGAERIEFGTPGSGPVRLTGYPDGSDDPLTCLGTMTQRDDGQLRVECTGYKPGTSGTPWLTDFDPATRTWAVVGVIGGYEQGGDTDDVSYSPYFGPDVQRLYQQAVQGA